MIIEIDYENTTLLSEDHHKPESLYAGPFINAEFQKSDKEGLEEWRLEIICCLKVSPEHIKDKVTIYMAEGREMMSILPMKQILIEKTGDFRCDKKYVWYIRTKSFELDELYNLVEVWISDDLSAGKKRGGRTIGIYTPLSKL